MRIANKYYEMTDENQNNPFMVYRVMYGVESLPIQFSKHNIEFDWIIKNDDVNHPINQHTHPLNLLKKWLKSENPV